MFNSLSKIGFLLLLAIWNIEGATAQTSFYYFKQLGIKEGLSQSRVQSILNDHKGYLWIGTGYGLNCYDRDHLKQYLHSSEEKKSLPSNDIYFVAEDSLLNLWVATSAGLCLYDRVNDCFLPIDEDGDGKLPVIFSYLLLDGGILFGGDDVLYKYDYRTQRLVNMNLKQHPGAYMPFKQMIRYHAEEILINTGWWGIYSFNLKKQSLKKEDMFSEMKYSCIYLDSHKHLWVCDYRKGLFCYKDGRLLKHFTTKNSPLTYDAIHDLVEKDNKLWVATDGGGINVISLDDFSFSKIQYMQDDINSFPASSVFRLYIDPQNNIWVGSVRDGLIGVKNVYARSFQNVPIGNPYGLSNRAVNCFLQDSDGLIWVGTDGGGINRFDPETFIFKHFPIAQYGKIASMVEYTADELLIYSFNKGLYLFNKHTGQLQPFTVVNQAMKDKINNGFSIFIQRISQNKILFSGEQIICYDMVTQKVDVVATIYKEFTRHSPLIITTVGTKTYFADVKNICEYDSFDGSFKTIYSGNSNISNVCRDKNGVFWIASENGLQSYNPLTKKLKSVQTSLFKEVNTILADDQKRIWIGTCQHLYVYFPETDNFAVLDEVDGVIPNEYIPRSTLLDKNGNILIGGTLGMTVIDRNICFNANVSNRIELLDVFLNGLSIPLDKKMNQFIETIKIPWDFSSLQLKVLLNDRDVFRKNIFRINVEEGSQPLIQSNSNSLIINHLPVGEFVITASYYMQNGEWSSEQQILHLIVCPPWWKTVWFYLAVCILAVTMIGYILYIVNRKRKIKHRREVTKLKNKIYEERINFLTNISHELRTPLTLICAPLKRIIDHKKVGDDIEPQLTGIYKQATQIKNIIDMVLDVRKLEEGQETLHITSQSLNDWIRSVGDNFISEFEIKGMRLIYQLDEEIEKVPFDKKKCEFVLSNFLVNALKFGESGTVTVITEMLQTKDWIRVAVKDEGVGLNMVDADSLFSNFYQGTHEQGGSGIGLSYAKSLIGYHKGKIGAINNLEQGATFYFELPLLPNDSAKINPLIPEHITVPTPRELAESDYTFLMNYSILLVEDTVDLRNYMKDTLKTYFAKVYAAKDGKEGLEQIKLKLPDIIVSDVMMPRMNGFELCRMVKTDLNISHIPFILLTAYHNSQNVYTGYKTGADCFLPKPFEIDGLLALIHNQLKLREQIKERYYHEGILTYKEMSFSNADETFLLKFNTLITENMSNPDLDVAFLAANMCISRSLLYNKIKAITGVGIVDYVNKLRIDKAVILLTTSSMNITEISEMVGFSSQKYFSKVFKSIKGEIPSAFRK